MPVNVTMHEPWTRVVRGETESNIITWPTDAHNVTSNGVRVVVIGATSNANNIEVVSVKMDRMRETTWE